jgi:ADP-ribose pyrophosphatase YjhB (NUDIX family)
VDRVLVGCGSLIEGDGGYLLVREAKASARYRYNLPAGKPEAGETLVEAAVREAREETGLEVAVDHLVGIYHCPRTSEGFGIVNFVFASHRLEGDPVPSAEHPEVGYSSRARPSPTWREGDSSAARTSSARSTTTSAARSSRSTSSRSSPPRRCSYSASATAGTPSCPCAPTGPRVRSSTPPSTAAATANSAPTMKAQW